MQWISNISLSYLLLPICISQSESVCLLSITSASLRGPIYLAGRHLLNASLVLLQCNCNGWSGSASIVPLCQPTWSNVQTIALKIRIALQDTAAFRLTALRGDNRSGSPKANGASHPPCLSLAIPSEYSLSVIQPRQSLNIYQLSHPQPALELPAADRRPLRAPSHLARPLVPLQPLHRRRGPRGQRKMARACCALKPHPERR